MSNARGDGDTPSSNRQEQPDQAHADAVAPGTDTGQLLVLVSSAGASARGALSAQVVLLLPGARVHAASPKDGADTAPCADRRCVAAMPAPSSRLVVRLVGEDPAVPLGWGDAPVAEVRPRDVDGENVPAAGQSRRTETFDATGAAGCLGLAGGCVDLADVALALARCGQLRRVAEPGLPSSQRLSGAALVSAMPEVLHPLLPGVWRTAETLIGQAGDALHAQDMALLARVAHTVRGMAANYAMPEWTACAAALECSARCADMAAAVDALAWLRAALAALSELPGLPGQSCQSGQSGQAGQAGQSGLSG